MAAHLLRQVQLLRQEATSAVSEQKLSQLHNDPLSLCRLRMEWAQSKESVAYIAEVDGADRISGTLRRKYMKMSTYCCSRRLCGSEI